MASHISAKEREETPHRTNLTNNNTLSLNGGLSNRLKRRARSVINNRSIDAGTRAVIRYGLEANDPWLAELVRRVNAGEDIGDTMDLSPISLTIEDDSIEEKVEALADMICREDDDSATKSAALLVLMATLENAPNPKALANTAKHIAFTRCGELNLYGIVDAQIPLLEGELFAGNFS